MAGRGGGRGGGGPPPPAGAYGPYGQYGGWGGGWGGWGGYKGDWGKGGKGYVTAGGPAAAGRAYQQQQYLQCAPQLTPALPYTAMGAGGHRSVTEHVARAPHRPLEAFDDDLKHSTPGWVKEPQGQLLEQVRRHVPLGVVDVQEERVAPAPAATKTPAGVNVRAFICGGIGSGRGHIHSRLAVVGSRARKEGGRGGTLQAYGVQTASKADNTRVRDLAKAVQAQSGADLSKVKKWHKLVELTYGDGEKTVFYTPQLDGIEELKFMSQADEKVEEVEEEEEYEEEVPVEEEKKDEAAKDKDGDTEMADGEKKEEEKPKTKTVKKKRTVKKEKKTYPATVVPEVTNVHALRTLLPSERPTAELCQAADAFDEWLQRDVAAALIPVLKKKREEAVTQRAEAEAAKELAAERKRKRDEIVTACKKQREEKEGKFKEQWLLEDEGKTDEELKPIRAQRAEQLKELTDEMHGMIKEQHQDLAEREAAEKAEAGSPKADGEKKKRVKVVYERDEEMFDLFQFFDRPKGAATTANTILDREHLARLLLCLETAEITNLKQALDLTTLGDLALTRRPLNYANIAAVRTEVELPPEPSPKKEEEKEGSPAKASPGKASPSKASPAKAASPGKKSPAKGSAE